MPILAHRRYDGPHTPLYLCKLKGTGSAYHLSQELQNVRIAENPSHQFDDKDHSTAYYWDFQRKERAPSYGPHDH